MEPIKYINSLNETYQSQGFPPYRWSEFDFSPWTPFEKRLDQACIALISSAGIFRDDQPAFNPWAVNDLSFREIKTDTPYDRLKLHHNYFDHRDAVKDPNCVYPVQRFKEMVDAGVIRSLAQTAVTLGMGRLYKRTALQEETTPEIVKILKAEHVDAAFLVPA